MYNDEKSLFENLLDTKAFWFYGKEDQSKTYHAALTSMAGSRHSSWYFNSTAVLGKPDFVKAICTVLTKKILDLGYHTPYVQTEAVFGSAMGAIPLAFELARLMEVEFGYTEKVGRGENETMVLKRFKSQIWPGKKILVVEDAISSGGTTRKTIAALQHAEAIVQLFIGAIVNNSTKKLIDSRRIISTITLQQIREYAEAKSREYVIGVWDPRTETCPLCRAGSIPINPKDNWEILQAQGHSC